MPSKKSNSQESIFIDFQAWKVCIFLVIFLIFQFLLAGIVHLILSLGEFEDLGMAGGADPEELAQRISLGIMTSLGGLVVAVPGAIASVYFLKLVLRVSSGIRFRISESTNNEKPNKTL